MDDPQERGDTRRVALQPEEDARGAARRAIAAHVQHWRREEAAARHGDAEAIHQLRVATRRLRALLRLFAPVLPVSVVTRGREGLAQLGTAIGAVRDLDVLALALAARARKLGRECREALAPLEDEIAQRRAAALAALVEQLDAPRTRRLLAILEGLPGRRLPSRSAVPLRDVAGTLVQPVLRSVVRAGRDLDADAPAAALHRLRVRVKRLRYACETLMGLGEERLQPVIARLVDLQDVLGEHQDAVTQMQWLWERAAAGGLPPTTLLAMGAVAEALRRRARRMRRRFPRAWRRFDRGRMRRAIVEGLAGEAVAPVAAEVSGP